MQNCIRMALGQTTRPRVRARIALFVLVSHSRSYSPCLRLFRST